MRKKVLSLVLALLVVGSLGACSSPQDEAESQLLTTGEVVSAPIIEAPKPGKGCKWVTTRAKSGGATFPKQRSQDPASILRIPAGASFKIEKCKSSGWVRVYYNGQVGWTDWG